MTAALVYLLVGALARPGVFLLQEGVAMVTSALINKDCYWLLMRMLQNNLNARQCSAFLLPPENS